MSKGIEDDVAELLEKHAIVDVLRAIAEVMQEPGGDSTNQVLIGKVIEDLLEIDF